MSENVTKKVVLSNVVWKFLERFLAQGVSLIVSIIIARILTPEDYSVVSLVAIFFAFANVLISGGLNTALIQKKDADVKDYSTILFTSFLLSLIIYGALFFAAPLISNLFHEESLILIIRVMGLILPVNAIKSIWCAYISSKLQFRKFFFATLGGTVVSAAVGIVMAVKGFGPWSLVVQQMSNTIIDTIILVAITRIGMKFNISLVRFKTLFSYGWKIMISSIISEIYVQVTPLVIGLRFSSSDLSYYTKGKMFPTTAASTINYTLSAVLFPVLSKKQDDKNKILEYTRAFMRVSSFVIFPILLGFLAISDTFVSVVLTDKWLPASIYIKMFCIASLFDIVGVGNCETIKAIGKSGTYLIMEIIKKTAYFITIALFVFFSNNPIVLASSAIACSLIALIVNSVPNKYILKYSFRKQFLDLFPNLVLGLVMSIIVSLIAYLVPMNGGIPLLITQIFIGMAIYFGLAFAFKNKSLSYIVSFLSKGKNR